VVTRTRDSGHREWHYISAMWGLNLGWVARARCTKISAVAVRRGIGQASRRVADEWYARRERDPQDGRRVLLRATAAGIRLREAKSVLDPVRVEQVLAQLSPGDRAAALKGLQLLARASQSRMRVHGRGIRGEEDA